MKKTRKIIALILIQAFLLMDIIWAAGGDFFVSEQKVVESTLAPQLQLDAQTLKGVFLDSANKQEKTEELTADSQTQKKQKGPVSLTSAVRNVVLTAILFVMIALPFVNPAFSAVTQARAPPVQVQSLPADMQKLSGDMQGLLESIARANKIENPSEEQDQTIATGISKKGLAFTSGLARKRVVSINNWIEQEWNRLSKSGQLDEYTSRTIGTPEGDAVAKMKLLVQIANPDYYKKLKFMNAAIYFGDIPGSAYTTGSRVAGTMGRPLIYINKKFIENTFWSTFALIHEFIHAGDIPQSYFGLAWKYNMLTLFNAVVFSFSDPAEDKAYEAEYKFTSKFGIVPEKDDRFVDEFDLIGPYYEQRWNSIGYHLLGSIVFNLLPFIFGIRIIRYLIRRRDAGSQYPGLRSSSKNSSRNNGDRRLVRKNRYKREGGNRFRSIILLPLLGLFQSLDFVSPKASLAGGFGQIISDGTGVALILGAILAGASIIGTVAWMMPGDENPQRDDILTPNPDTDVRTTKENIEVDELYATDDVEEAVVENQEQLMRNGFAEGELDSVIFIDIDLMRLKNTYIGKKNVNLLLEVVENELNKIAKQMGIKNALTLRRGGDEFVLALNANGDKQKALKIAEELKKRVENAKFAVGVVDPEALNENTLNIIKSLGGNVDTVGRKHVLILPQEHGGRIGKQRIIQFIDQVNNIRIKDAKGEKIDLLKMRGFWLNRKAVDNQVGFTLSMGLAHKNEAIDQNVDGEDLYEKTHNLAAFRKDGSKAGFRKLGNGHIEAGSMFAKKNLQGESIAADEEGKKHVKDFQKLQKKANKAEKQNDHNGVSVAAQPAVRYFSSQDAFREFINSIYNKEGAIVFALQGLGYYDHPVKEGVSRIEKYSRGYYDAPAAIRDNRIDIRDFKVINEAYGYIAGDEAIAILRMAAMQFPKLFEHFELVMVRGPPAGPMGVLVPKTEKAKKMSAEEIESLFAEYCRFVKDIFNRNSIVKLGQARVIWDRFKAADESVGMVLERIQKTRSLFEYTYSGEVENGVVLGYSETVEERGFEIEEKLAWEGVDDLSRLQAEWWLNKQTSTNSDIDYSTGKILNKRLELLNQDAVLNLGQSI